MSKTFIPVQQLAAHVTQVPFLRDITSLRDDISEELKPYELLHEKEILSAIGKTNEILDDDEKLKDALIRYMPYRVRELETMPLDYEQWLECRDKWWRRMIFLPSQCPDQPKVSREITDEAWERLFETTRYVCEHYFDDIEKNKTIPFVFPRCVRYFNFAEHVLQHYSSAKLERMVGDGQDHLHTLNVLRDDVTSSKYDTIVVTKSEMEEIAAARKYLEFLRSEE